LLGHAKAAGVRPHIVFANSTHSTRPSAYGESKRIAAETLADWAASSRAIFSNLILPHVFGEGCRPHYNSAVATFCHQLAHGEVPRIIEDGELELIHAQRVAEEITGVIDRAQAGEIRLHGTPIRVSAVLAMLQNMAALYTEQIIPELGSELALDLFNSYRSYLFPHRYPFDLTMKQDARAVFSKQLKRCTAGSASCQRRSPALRAETTTTAAKLSAFLVVQGEALIRVRRLISGDIVEFPVSGSRPQYVDMPTLHTHNITNTGAAPLTTLFWTQEIFDAENPDTYVEAV
jgi:UDP-2-acetamido-2,6-beta-L-arabino-hexul-4-ose reductase